MKSIWLLILASFPLVASADTIYKCRAYAGGTFWAQAHCKQHNALVESVANVPSGMSFDQQIAVAQGGQAVQQQRRQSESHAVDKRIQCNGIDQEMQAIWKPYGEAQYVPPEVVGPDRRRWLDLEVKRNSLGCGR